MKRFKQLLIPLIAAVTLVLAAGCVEAANTTKAAKQGTFKQTSASVNAAKVGWTALFKETAKEKIQCYKLVWGRSKGSLTGSSGNLTAKTNSYTITGLDSNSSYYAQLSCLVLDDKMNTTTYTKEVTLYTVPGKVTGFTSYDFLYTQKGLEIGWDEVPGTNPVTYQYEIYNTSGALLKSGSKSANALFMASYKYYKQVTRLRVRATYRTPGGTVLQGEWSKTKSLVPQPILKKSAKKYMIDDNGKLKLAWTRVTGASKYRVYCSTSPNSGYKKIATVKQKKTNLITVTPKKTFKKNTDYYIRVVTVTKKDGKSIKRICMPIWRNIS